MNQDVLTLSQSLAKLLINGKQSLSVAESCTGGWLSKTLTDLPGSSAWFSGSVVSYSNKAKQNILNVSDKALVENGAVSALVAEGMAEGVMQAFESSFSISITGIAGPGGGTKSKLVGLVFFGVKRKGLAAYSIQKNFSGSRDEIRLQAVEEALRILLVEVTQ
ncbi:MAG: damage-inducible protein CinA [Cycloclasticus sp. symbiont of Poecilosclerida sp. M]|nr:MAG: damage-inducible protein CinA [Cycloclasticus sp. symbiont of Poecilosclerida sp. M]